MVVKFEVFNICIMCEGREEGYILILMKNVCVKSIIIARSFYRRQNEGTMPNLTKPTR